MSAEEINTYHNYEITCPHCGYEHSDSWDRLSGCGDREGAVVTCENEECEKDFYANRNVEVTYSSRPATVCQYLDDHGMNCSWEPGDERPHADKKCRPCACDDHHRALALAAIKEGSDLR